MSDDVNVPRLKEMAIRGRDYREEYEITYFGETATLYLKALDSEEYIPIVGTLQSKMDIGVEEAREKLEEEGADDGEIDPSELDDEFVDVMKHAAFYGIDPEMGAANGLSDEDLRAILGLYEGDDEDLQDLALKGGTPLEIAYEVLGITSDADSAEKFRRDGGGE